ncbi:hypothetical protein GE061_001128 [Apolygus lucorum]|uniref:Uncharacterized protein n=1 Tax=Apolygus lucorum TaxID=248454 RepID=A0A8S9Y8P1_APOLU|nr:hypothetical protein GE061_001128 [Apolygus lucorum]
MDILIRINNQTTGRDKIARLIQYSSRALWYFIQQNRISGAKSIEKIKRLENVFSTFRKILRFGRFIESFYGASKSLDCPNQLLKFTVTLSKLAFGMYLFCDHVICLEKTGLMEIHYQKWYMMSSKYWLYALSSMILRDCYEIMRNVALIKKQPELSHLFWGFFHLFSPY